MRLFMSDQFFDLFTKLPKDAQQGFVEFKDKFRECSTTNGLHLEPVKGAKDDSIRSARINRDFRVILSAGANGVFTVLYVGHHEEAYHWAENKKCVWNDVSQAYQIVTIQNTTENVSYATFKAPEKTQEKPTDYLSKVPTPDNVTDDQLKKIGIPTDSITAVRALRTWTDLERIENTLPDDAYERLFEFCDGGNIDIIVNEVQEGCAENGGDVLLSSNNRRHFIEITGTDLLAICEQGLEKWQLFLHPSQRKVVESGYKGTMKISGSAGTGKTVAALHRLKHLCENKQANVLFTTFTTTLCENLKSLAVKMDIVNGRYTLTNIDKLMVELAKKYSLGEVDYTGSLKLWQTVVETEATEFEPTFLKAEYEDVILYNGNETQDSYLRQTRIGRGRSLTRKQRVEVWGLVEKYRKLRAERGSYDRYEMFNRLTCYLNENNIRPFTNVIADEIQDFSNPELRFLRALVAEGANDLFLAGDPYQKVYSARKLNFAAAGINIRGSKSRKLKVNYRTTEEIKRRAVSVVKGVPFDDFDGGEENVVGYISLMHGDIPVYEMTETPDAEGKKVLDWIANLKNNGIEYSDICIAAPNNNALRKVKDLLHRQNIASYDRAGKTAEGNSKGINLCTFHSIKGLEFKAVILVGVNEQNVPSKITNAYPFTEKDSVQQKDYLMQMRSLLYVAITRAREATYITGCGEMCGLLK